MADKSKKPRKYLTKRKTIVLSVIVLAVVATIVAYLVSNNEKRQAAEAEDQKNRATKVISSEEVSGKIEQEKDQSEKARLYLDLAMTKQQEGSPDEALDAALKSAELKPTHDAYAIAGGLYKLAENKEKAIEMFRKALELAEKTDNPNEVTPYNNYRMEIMELGGEA